MKTNIVYTGNGIEELKNHVDKISSKRISKEID